jgi:hypothetical protein
MSYNGPQVSGPTLGPQGVLARTSLLTGSRTQIRYDPRSFNTQNKFGDPRDWKLWPARRSRYAIQWSHYEGTLFDSINPWIESLKEDKALYQFVRHIYSPANRLGEFWATHIFGGALDPNAGGGFPTPSAIPILTQNEDLRPAIARLWNDSNWQVHKETVGRFGSVMGDVAITIVDDPGRGMVKLQVIDPREIFHVEEDKFGNCRGYILKKMVPDPEWSYGTDSGANAVPYVEYTEVCYRQGETVVYETYRDGLPYDWSRPLDSYEDDGRWRWTEPYGFIPFIRIQHKNVGIGWGWSEFTAALLSKLYELDDQASKFGDYVRRAVDSPWLFTGMNAEEITAEDNVGRRRSSDSGGGDKERVPFIYAIEPNARAQPLIAPLDLPAVMENIKSILRVIEQEHPELTADLALATGDASGRALRVAKEKAEALVVQRRATYDDAIRRAHQMAISIGAMRQYRGYAQFGETAYLDGTLDHQIGQRPVFALTEWELLEVEKERATVVETLTRAGVPLAAAWRRAGYKDSEISQMLKDREEDLKFNLRKIQVMQTEAANDGASYGLSQ